MKKSQLKNYFSKALCSVLILSMVFTMTFTMSGTYAFGEEKEGADELVAMEKTPISEEKEVTGASDKGKKEDVADVEIETEEKVAKRSSLGDKKEELISAIEKGDDVVANKKDYYTEKDTYNGKEFVGYNDKKEERSFWFQFEKALEKAKEVRDKEDASEADISTAKETLEKAVANLIPKTQLNTSDLYERIYAKWLWRGDSDHDHRYVILYEPSHPTNFGYFEEKTTSKFTWKPYSKAKSEAETYFKTLYDKNGNPTEANKPENVDKMNAVLGPLKTAMDKLDRLSYNPYFVDFYKYAQRQYNRMPFYFDKWYNPEKMDKELYTEESWNAFVKAAEEARACYHLYPEPTEPIGEQEDEKIKEKYAKLVHARNQLKAKEEKEITVSVKVIDNHLNRIQNTTNVPNLEAYEREVKTTTRKNLGEILVDLNIIEPKQEGSNYQFMTLWSKKDSPNIAQALIGTFLNGKFLEKTYYDRWYGFTFQDGDEIEVVRLVQPIRSTSSGVGHEPVLVGVEKFPFIKKLELTVPKETKLGQKVKGSVTVTAADVSTYDGKKAPYSKFSVSVGKIGENTLTEMTKTEVRGDENGNFTYTFYEEGDYLISVHPVVQGDDRKDISGLTAGTVERIHVNPTDEAGILAIKEKLKKELKEIYTKYPKTFYIDKNWEELNKIYDKAIKEIDSEKNLVKCGKLKNKAEKDISEFQENISIETKRTVESFQMALEKLPKSIEDFGKGQIYLFKDADKRYNKLSEYGKSQITVGDKEKYIRFKEAYGIDGKNLPESKKYRVNVKFVDEDRNEERLGKYLELYEKLSIKDEVFLKKSLGDAYQDYMNFLTFYGADPIGTSVYFEKDEDGDYVGDLQKGFYVIGGTESVMTSAGTALMTEYLNNLGKNKKYELNKDFPSLSYDKKKRIILIDGKPYDFVDANFNFEMEGSKEDAIHSIKSMSLITYDMPYHDVEVELVLGEVSLDSNFGPSLKEINKAKEIAKDAIESAYQLYKKEDYTSDNWKRITKIKTDAEEEIDGQKKKDKISAIKEKALKDMAAVNTLAQDNDTSQTTGGASGQALPDYGPKVGKVHIIVENQTFKSKKASWQGRLIDGWYDLCEDDTMMTSILKALQLKGCTWSTGSQGQATSWGDYKISYLASIMVPEDVKGDGTDFVLNNPKIRLGEFSGESGSGWMGTLNDWFTNFGFQEFKYKNGRLEDGDVIHVQFTQDLGVDLGGKWGDSDTRLKTLEIEGKGRLVPSFSPDIKKYVYIIDEPSDNIKVTPTAMNKNYLIKTFLNGYDKALYFYKRFRTIPVKSGDTVYVGCGEYTWPSMNKQSADAIDYTGTKYEITVMNGVAEFIQKRINELPEPRHVSLSNFNEYEEEITDLVKQYNKLSKEEKESLKGVDKMKGVEKEVKFFSEIQNVKTLLGALPKDGKTSDFQVKLAKFKIEKAAKAYKALSDKQKKYITVSDVENYNALVERLKNLKEDIDAEPIEGSDVAPETIIVEAAAKVKDGVATVTPETDKIKEAVDKAKKIKATKITIEATETKSAKKIVTTLKKDSVRYMAESKVAGTLRTKVGEVSIPVDGLKSIAAQAEGDEITIEIEAVEKPEEEKTKAIGKDGQLFTVTVTSNGKEITTFNGSKITLKLEIPKNLLDKKVAAVYVKDNGELEVMEGRSLMEEGKKFYEFETSHFSDFALVDGKALGLEDKEEAIIEGVKNTKIKAKSNKLKNGKIKVTWDKSKGYRVDYYEVYRSVKRYSGFGRKAFFTTKKTKNSDKRWYINSKSLKKGTRYYYKVRGVRMVDGKKVYTKWSTKAFRIA